MRTSLFRRFRRSEQGAVILETALMITILLMLTFGIIDMGRLLYTANGLASAAREGARFGAVDPDCANLATHVKDTVRTHFTPFGGAALTNAQIAVTAGLCTGASVRVVVTYPFSWLTPLPRLFGWGASRNVQGVAEYKYEL